MSILNFKRNDTKFAFIESNNTVSLYKLKAKTVSYVTSCERGALLSFLEKVKKDHSEILKSTNLWILDNARIENAEKAPLTKQEMLEYARWKLQDVVDLPMQDVAYDILTNNGLEPDFFQKILTAVVVKKTIRDDIIKEFKSVKIPLHAIDCMQTALIDFFKKVDDAVNPVGFLKVDSSSATMSVYWAGGIVLSRHIELPKLLELEQESNTEAKMAILQLVIDRLNLELQRNIDFLGRQYKVNQFEKMVFSLPSEEIFENLKSQVKEYFTIKELDFTQHLDIHAEQEQNIAFEVLAMFYRGQKTNETINLLPTDSPETTLLQDAKKVVMFACLAGLGCAIVGGVYEWRARATGVEVEDIKKDNVQLMTDIEKMKSKPVVGDETIQKEINSLLQTKDTLLQLQSQQKQDMNHLFAQFMSEVATTAKSSGIYLQQIQYSQQGVLLRGYSLDRQAFAGFLAKLQNSPSLGGKSLKSISMGQNSQNNRFEFIISSEEASRGVK